MIALIATVHWGNGAVEEGRIMWQNVFYGTVEQCQTHAEEQRQQAAADSLSARVKDPHASHAKMPLLYNRGVQSMEYVSAVCAPFASSSDIKRAFPRDWEGMPGARVIEGGGAMDFAWWDGPTGRVFQK